MGGATYFVASGGSPVNGSYTVWDPSCRTDLGTSCNLELDGTATSPTFSSGTGSYKSGSLTISFSYDLQLVACPIPNIYEYCGTFDGSGTDSDGASVSVTGWARTTDLKNGSVYGAMIQGSLIITTSDADPMEEAECIAGKVDNPDQSGDQICSGVGYVADAV